MADELFVVLHGSSSDLVWFLDEVQHEDLEVRILEVRPHWISAQHGDVWLTIVIGFATGVASNVATDWLKSFVATYNRKRAHRTRTTITVLDERPVQLEQFDTWGSE
jgi:hypothetical protein